MAEAFELRGLHYVYPGGVTALAGIDLVVPVGQSVALVGQNGSGKSTLVRHLNGLLRPTQGSVLVAGQPIGSQPVSTLARSVGLAFQNPDLQIFEERVVDEVSVGPRRCGFEPDQVRAAVDAAIEVTGLTGLEMSNPFNLGYSRRKLVAIASILAMLTPVVVLDEPTTGQDAAGVNRIAAIVAEMRAEGRTVVGISHDLRFVAENFDRVIVLRAGRIITEGSPEEVFGRACWSDLASSHLEPPGAARVGHDLGLGSTPTDAIIRERLRATR